MQVELAASPWRWRQSLTSAPPCGQGMNRGLETVFPQLLNAQEKNSSISPCLPYKKFVISDYFWKVIWLFLGIINMAFVIHFIINFDNINITVIRWLFFESDVDSESGNINPIL